MAQLINIDDRRIVPLWKSFYASIPELKSRKTIIAKHGDIASFVRDWQQNPNMANAGDLIGAAILQHNTDDDNVKSAVEYVLNHKEQSSIPLYNVVSGLFETEDVTIDTVEDLTYFEQIARLKEYLSNYPADAICHMEIARLYVVLGQLNKAEYHVNVAIKLDSNNRYIVRAAARFYMHIKKNKNALSLIRSCKMYKRDPWLLAAEISLCQLSKITSREINRGLELIESGNYADFELTELSSAIGTEEMIHGAYTKSKRLFNKSLLDPNDNSLAQAQWVVENNNFQFDEMERVIVPEHFWEANAYRYFMSKDYNYALKCSKRWIEQEQYSTRATLYAYRLAATYLKNLKEGEEILKNSLVANRGDKLLINDYAYTLALNGNTAEAERQILKAKNSPDDAPEIKICITATKGLIAFRKGNIEDGHGYYTNAILEAMNYPRNPYLYCSAVLNYSREILLNDAKKENVELVVFSMEKLSDAKVIEENLELQQIKEYIEELLRTNQAKW